MNTGEIIHLLQCKPSRELYNVACKMLEDEENGNVELPDSIEQIQLISSICETISNSSNNRLSISAKQNYKLCEFVSNNLCAYGCVDTQDDVYETFSNLAILEY